MDTNNNRKIFKYFIVVVCAVLIVCGQMLILARNDFIWGTSLCVLSILLFLVFRTPYFIKAALTLLELANKARAVIEQANETIKFQQPQDTGKKQTLKAELQTPAQKANTGIYQETQTIQLLSFHEINFSMPKTVFFILALVLAGLSQVFLFRHSVKFVVIFVAAALTSFFIFISAKDKELKIRFELKNILIFFLGTAGIILVAFGWILLLNNNVNLQELGTALTAAGAVLIFAMLPENHDKNKGKAHEILFACEDEAEKISGRILLDSPLFKSIMLVTAFIFIEAGNRLISGPKSMYAIGFYSAAIVCIFFLMPLFGFPKEYTGNKYINITRLAMIAVSFFIAYKAQELFKANNPDKAILWFIAAAALFIFASPVYIEDGRNREEAGKIPLKLEIAYLAAIVLVGIFLRTYELDTRPFGLENDETGGFIGHLLDKMHGKINFNVGNYGILFNVTNLFVYFFGVNRVMLKIAAVITGVLAIPCVYFFIRKAISVRAAMFSATIYCFLRIMMHYSRAGHATILATLTMSAAIYFMINAMKKRDKASYFLSGLFMSYGWHALMTQFLLIIAPVAYYSIKILTTKNFLKKNYIGLIAFALGFWIFASMVFHNYFLSSRIYFSRVHEVSVFSNDPNAPKNVGQGIVDNTKRVLLMFNHIGDFRERNSGAKNYEPTIDATSAIFFAMGIIYCMYYSMYSVYFIMLLMFFSQAAGSIFSIEAPSAMRSLGTIVPVIFFIGVIFERTWSALKDAFGKKWESIYLPVLFIVPLFFIIKANYYQYFQRWIPGLDEMATAGGMYSEKLGKSYRIFLHTSLYYPGHPPYRFFRGDYKVNSSNKAIDALANLTLIEDENYAILLEPDTWDTLPYWLEKFPGAKHDSVTHSFFNKKVKENEGLGKFFDSVLISNNEIQSIKGLRAEYYYGNGSKETVENDLPLFTDAKANQTPYKVVWSGEIFIPGYGPVSFYNREDAPVSIFIDNHKVEMGNNILLARGFHKIKIESQRKDRQSKIKLNFSTMGSNNPGVFEMDKKYLYSFGIEGLHEYYYNKLDLWDKNNIVNEDITPYIWLSNLSPDLNPAIKWQGEIDIQKDGTYRIFTRSNNYVRIEIDNKQYWDINLTADVVKKIAGFFKNDKASRVDNFNLNKGKHNIEIYAYYPNSIDLLWDEGTNGVKNVFLPPDILEPDFQISTPK